ncbi:bacillithiol system redox-active protein YtxJ [Fictibacillus iocasae]|uniref:Bacillithiol system redox-active protein YtxJ n=1 Tax=Fictibacillus iocasae TaxID=2715437 RepID=A0ABW2NS93_9BACL
MLKQLNNETDWSNALNESDRFFLLKNSTTCPVSHEGYRQFEKFAAQHPEETFYYLNVQDARALSNKIAEDTGIKHESPQVFLFNGGSPVWNASHWSITVKKMEEVLTEGAKA